MKKNIVLFFIQFISISLFAQGVQFHEISNWRTLREIAKKEQKYILVDAFATWCIPCRQMDTATFKKKQVGDYINTKFISLRVQMDKTNKDTPLIRNWYQDAKYIGKTYNINAYPTILVFDSSTTLIGRITGYQDAEEFIKSVDQIILSSKTIEPLYQEYLKGSLDTSKVMSLVTSSEKIGRTELAKQIAKDYINKLPEEELVRRHNLRFLYSHTFSSSDRGFKFFMNRGAFIDSVMGLRSRDASKKLFNKIVYQEEIQPFINSGGPKWPEIESTIAEKYPNFDLEFYNGVRMHYASEQKAWEEMGKYYALYFKTAYSRSAYHINNFSWLVFDHVTDKQVLEIAIQTMKFNLDKYDRDNVDAWDTYANLLYKVGRIDEALENEKKAIQLSKGDKQFVETLDKMKRSEQTWQD